MEQSPGSPSRDTHNIFELFADTEELPKWHSWLRTCLPMQETRVLSPSQQDPLEEEMATHSSILAWRIPWMEEPARLQSIGSQRVAHN